MVDAVAERYLAGSQLLIRLFQSLFVRDKLAHRNVLKELISRQDGDIARVHQGFESGGLTPRLLVGVLHVM